MIDMTERRLEALLNIYGERYLNHRDALALWKKGEVYHFINHAKQYEGYLKPGNVLLLGCGVGHQVWAFQYLGYDAYGCDFSEYAIKNAVTKNCTCCNINNMPYKDGQFDNVIAFDIVEHIPMDWLEDVLKECRRVTKKMFLARIPFETTYGERAYKIEDVLTEHMINQDTTWWFDRLRKHFVGWKEENWINKEQSTWKHYRYIKE